MSTEIEGDYAELLIEQHRIRAISSAYNVPFKQIDIDYIWFEAFRTWFPTSNGWKVRLLNGTDSFTVGFKVCVNVDSDGQSIQDGNRERLASEQIVILDRDDAVALQELKSIMEEVSWECGMSAVWGVAAVGFRWMAVKKERSAKVESIVDWKNDVLDFESSEIMRNLAHTIKGSV
ncbi:hypothetical protein FRC04_011256 [Tulasnella sp. 424]|nr:hypothetical protein FRC04_011256 [Tulasnella sp. 424]KAG8971799.1 hypothetical protein FRC05_010758 [Tulasnella sp. 425]